MKRINILYCLLFGLVFFLPSCLRTEDDLFDESAALRINHAITDAKETLVSANNGWIMQYFPTNDYGGVTFLVKFNTDDMATMAAKDTTYKETKGTWKVIGDSGPVLTFDSYNDVFHIYSDPTSGPDGLGVGWGGDYEFIVMNVTDDFIQLKGKKRGTDITLQRLADNQKWEDYFAVLENMDAFLFNKNVPVDLSLRVNDKTYILKNGSSHIFTASPVGEVVDDEESADFEIPFIITSEGIRFAKKLEASNLAVRTFKLSDDKNSLLCTDEGVDAKIIGPELVPYFFSAIDTVGLKWALSTGDTDMSLEVKSIYTIVRQAFVDKKMELSTVSYMYSSRNNTDAVYIVNTKGAGGYLYFDKEQLPEGVKFTFKESFDNNGRTFYNTYDGVADLTKLLSGSFKIENAVSELNPVKVKLTNMSNPNIWFITNLQ